MHAMILNKLLYNKFVKTLQITNYFKISKRCIWDVMKLAKDENKMYSKRPFACSQINVQQNSKLAWST